jgi:WD40 repeat protein
VAWSPDGASLASGSSDQTIKVWNTKTGKCVSTLTGHTGQVMSVAWNNDGTKLATGSHDNTTKIWAVGSAGTFECQSTGQCRSTRHKGLVTSVAWNNDGSKLATGSWDNTIKIWAVSSAGTFECQSTLTGDRAILCVSFSPNSNILAAGDDGGKIRLYDPETGEVKTTLTTDSSVTKLEYVDEETLVSGSNDGTMKVWSVATGRRSYTVTWRPDGESLASTSDDKTVTIWDPSTGQVKWTLTGDRAIFCVSFSPDSNILAACDNGGNIRLYDLATGELKTTLSGNEVNTTIDALLEVDKIIPQEWIKGVHYQVEDSDRFEVNEICVIRRSDGTWRFGKILEIESEMSYKVDVSISTTKSGIPGDNVGKIFCHSTRKDCLRSYTVTWSPDGESLASTSDDKTVTIWDPSTGQVKWTLTGDRAIFCVSFSPDSNILAACGNGGNIRLYDLATGEVKSTLSGPLRGLDVNTTIDALLEVDKIIPRGSVAFSKDSSSEEKVGKYSITFKKDLLLISEDQSVVAFFRAPDEISAMGRAGEIICVGCNNGEVLQLRAHWLV